MGNNKAEIVIDSKAELAYLGFIMTNQTTKRRIHQNVWGNWNGYEGTRKVKEFGTGGGDAEEWLQGVEPLPLEPLVLRRFDFAEPTQKFVICEPDPSLIEILSRIK